MQSYRARSWLPCSLPFSRLSLASKVARLGVTIATALPGLQGGKTGRHYSDGVHFTIIYN